MIIKIENGKAVGYPIYEDNFRYLFPDTVFPRSFTNGILEGTGYEMYDYSQTPIVGPLQKLVEVAPTKHENGNWYQTWSVVDLTGEELVVAQAKQIETTKQDIIVKTQTRLDAFARTRNYDGILSACTYVTSTVPSFKSDADYCVSARDATWAALYAFMTVVEAGQAPMPTSFADVEPLLPVLSWPA